MGLLDWLTGGNKKEEKKQEPVQQETTQFGADLAPYLYRLEKYLGDLSPLEQQAIQNPAQTVTGVTNEAVEQAQKQAQAQAKKAAEEKKEPWQLSEHPFASQEANNMYKATWMELRKAATGSKEGLNPLKDAFEIVKAWDEDVFKAADLYGNDRAGRNPFKVAGESYREKLEKRKLEYSINGKSGQELKALLEGSGYQSRSAIDEANQRAAIAYADKYNKPEENMDQATRDTIAAYNDLYGIIDQGKMYGWDSLNLTQMYALQNAYDAIPGLRAGVDALNLDADLKAQLEQYGKGMAAELSGKKELDYAAADKLISQNEELYDWAKSAGGDLAGTAAAMENMEAIVNKVLAGTTRTLTDSQRAALDIFRAQNPEMSLDVTVGGQLTPEQWEEVRQYGQQTAEALNGYGGMFNQYAPTMPQQVYRDAWRKTPEGAKQWAEETTVGDDEWDKAQANLKRVTNEEKYSAFRNHGNYQELTRVKEENLKFKVYARANGMESTAPERETYLLPVGGNPAGLFDFSHAEEDKYLSIVARLTPDEKKEFTAIVNDQGLMAGYEYLDYMQPETDRRHAEQLGEEAKAFGADGPVGGVVGSLMQIPLNGLRGMGAVSDTLQDAWNYFTGLLGRSDLYQPRNENDLAHLPGLLEDKLSEGTMSQVDVPVNIAGHDVDLFDVGYGTLMSWLKSMGIGEVAQGAAETEKGKKLISFLMNGLNAAQSGRQEADDADVAEWKKWLYGLGAGVNEGLWEAWSIGKFWDNASTAEKRTFAQNLKEIFKSIVSNAEEEGATTAANITWGKATLGDEDKYGKAEDDYGRLGLGDEAHGRATGDAVFDIALDAVTGGLMGGLSGVSGNRQNSSNYKQMNRYSGSQIGQDTRNALWALAAMPEMQGTEAAKIAKETSAQKANDKQVGELFRALSMGGTRSQVQSMGIENPSQTVDTGLYGQNPIGSAATEAMVKEFKLMMGLRGGAMNDITARALADLMAGKPLSEAQMNAVAADPAAMDIVNRVLAPNPDKATPRQEEARQMEQEQQTEDEEAPLEFEDVPGEPSPSPDGATSPEVGGNPSQSADADSSPKGEPFGGAPKGEAFGAPSQPRPDAETPRQREAEQLRQEAETLSAPSGQLPQGGALDGEAQPRTPNPAKETPRQREAAQIPVKVKGEERHVASVQTQEDGSGIEVTTREGDTVDLDDIEAGETEKEVLRAAADMEDTEAQTDMLSHYDGGSDTQAAHDYAAGYKAVHDAAAKGTGYEDVKSIYGDTLTEDQRKAAHETGRRWGEALKEKKRLRNIQAADEAGFEALQEGTGNRGGVFFSDVDSGMKNEDGSIDKAKRVQLRVLNDFGQKNGIQYRVVDKGADENAHYEVGTNVVYVALDAEGGALTRAASHETMHFIQEYAADMAQKIRDYVLERLKKVTGYDLEARIAEVMSQYTDHTGKPVTRAYAEEEIVADSLLDVIGTEEALSDLAKKTGSGSAIEKIGNWIKKTYAQLRELVNRYAKNSPEARALKDDVDYLGQVSDLFQKGVAAAREAYRQAQEGLYNSVKGDSSVQEYVDAMSWAVTENDRAFALDELVKGLYERIPWKAKIENGLAKFRQALLDYKQQKIALSVAMERNGLEATPQSMNAALGYAAGQMVSQEAEAAVRHNLRNDTRANDEAYEKAHQLYEGKDLSEDKTLYDYNFLTNLPDIRVTTEKEMGTVIQPGGSIDHSGLKELGRNYSSEYGEERENGKWTVVTNDYTGKKIVLTGDSYDHSTHGKTRNSNIANAYVGAVAGELAKKAVPINALYDDENAHGVQGTYAMAAPVITADGKKEKVAVLTIEMRTGNLVGLEVYDTVHAVSSRKRNESGAGAVNHSASVVNPVMGMSTNPRSSISISEFLEIVKGTHKGLLSENVLSHMNDKKPTEGVWKDRAKFNLRHDTQARQENQTVNDTESDAELYAQLKGDENARAALRMLDKLYKMVNGGEGQAISREELKKRLPYIVKRIIDETGSKYDKSKISQGITKLYDALNQPGYKMGELLRYSRELAQKVIEAAPGVAEEPGANVKEALKTLRTTAFHLTDEQKKAIGTEKDVKNYARKNWGKVKISSKAGPSLEDVWRGQLSKLAPEVFTPDTEAGDMPDILDAWLETAGKKTLNGDWGANIGAASTDLGMNMILEFFNSSDVLKARNELNRKQSEINYQMYQSAERLIQTVKEDYERKYRERLEKDKLHKEERARRDSVITGIRRDTRWLEQRAMRGTDQKHIPEALRGLAEQTVKLMGDDRAIFSGEEAKNFLLRYERMAHDQQLHDPDLQNIANLYDPDIAEKLQWLSDHVKEKRLKQMTEDELKQVADVVSHIRFLAEHQNQIEVDGKRTAIEKAAKTLMEEMKAKGPASDKKAIAALRKVMYKEMTAPYFGKQAGGVLETLMNDLLKSQSQYAFTVQEAHDFHEEMVKKYHVNDWLYDDNLRMTTQAGDDIELTKGFAMTVYAWWEREIRNTVQDANHLTLGGFTYMRGNEDVKKMKGVDFSKSHVLSEADMRTIRDYLTDEQKSFIKDMVGYLSGPLAEKGNEMSMKLHGYKKFTEKWYFPNVTDRNFRGQNSTEAKGAAQEKKLKNRGFTKALTQHASNPLMLDDFNAMWLAHADEMARYSAMTQALENLDRVTNYVVGQTAVKDGSGNAKIIAPVSVKKEIEAALGTEGVRYLEQYLRDVNGGVRNDERGFSDKMISLFKKGSVAANLSVVVQQPSAFVRAMSMVSPKYFRKGLIEKGGRKATRERMYKNSGVAIIKRMGRFDTNVGKSAVDYIGESIKDESKLKRVTGWLDDKMGIMAEKADELTWTYMYSAIENEIEDRPDLDLQRGTAEFDKAVGERFDQVMSYTQVYDSTLVKSEWMRGTSTFDKMTTTFLSEPTMWINMLMDAALDVKNKKPGAKRHAARAAMVYVFGCFVNAALQSLITAGRKKKDEGETIVEKYLGELAGNFGDAISLEGIFGMIPIARDIVSMRQGYDVDRADLSVLNDVIEAWNKLEKKVQQGEATPDDWINLGLKAANVFGIPARNIYRDLTGLWGNLVTGEYAAPISTTSLRDIKYAVLDNASPLTFLKTWDDAYAAYYQRMADALIAGDEKTYNELRGYMEETQGRSPEVINSGVNKALQNAWQEGKLGEEKDAIELIKKYMDMDDNDAYYQVRKWEQKNEWDQEEHEAGDEYSYDMYKDFKDAVRAGKGVQDLKKIIENHVAHGRKANSVGDSLYYAFADEYKELLAAGKKTEAIDLKAKIVNGYEASGRTRSKAISIVDNWVKEKKK